MITMNMTFVLMILVVSLVVLLTVFMVVLAFRLRRRPSILPTSLPPLADTLLQTLLENSNSDVRERLIKQLALLRPHQKVDADESLTFEMTAERRDQAAVEAADVRFPNRSRIRLANMSFSIKEDEFTTEFNAFNGRLLDLIIRPDPGKLANRRDIKVDSFERITDPFSAAVPST